MKKALVILLAFAMVGVAFADEPKAELKVIGFSGNAALLVGADLDTGSVAFGNTGNVNFEVQIVAEGDKSAPKGEGVWGQLKILTDGDPVRYKVDADPTEAVQSGAFENAMKFKIDVAQLNFPNGYIGIKKDGTKIDYVQLADMAAPYFKVDTTKFYGQKTTKMLLDDDLNVGPNAAYGFVADYKLPDLLEFKVDLRSFNALDTSGTGLTNIDEDDADEYVKNAFGLRAKAILLAVKDFTFEAAMDTGFGGKDMIYDMGLGGKVKYKLMLDEKMYLQPNAAFNVVIDNAADMDIGTVAVPNVLKGRGTEDGTGDLSYLAQAGVLLGWGAKAKAVDFYFFDDSDADWGYYPGVSAGVIYKGAEFGGNAAQEDATMGMNVSFMSGDFLDKNLTAAAALEIADLMADDMVMGFSTAVKYAMPMGDKTLTPKFGLNYYSDASKKDEAATAIYVKAGLDIGKIFPNTTLSFEYASNDFNGGVNDQAEDPYTLGIFYTKLKIAF